MKTFHITRHFVATFGSAVLLLISSTAICGARDRFVYDPTPPVPEKPHASTGSKGSSAPTGIRAVIAAGETREVFNAATAPDMAFYVPEMSPTMVQVVIQKGLFKKPVYSVRGIRPGTVTGGIVPRALLDKSGFRPNNITDAARVQAALKANPITITVR